MCPYRHNDKCNRNCRGFQCLHRDETRTGTATRSGATMAVPTAEGMVDAVQALQASCEAVKWTLLAPDGRVWMNADPMILFAALAQVMQGRELWFGEH